MDNETLTWIFLIGGIILMVLETVLPSGLAFILGFSGLLVGILRFLGIFADPTTATLVWFLRLCSNGCALPFIKKHFGGETSFKVADEDYGVMIKSLKLLRTSATQITKVEFDIRASLASKNIRRCCSCWNSSSN